MSQNRENFPTVGQLEYKTSSLIINQYSKPKLKTFIYNRPVAYTLQNEQNRDDIYNEQWARMNIKPHLPFKTCTVSKNKKNPKLGQLEYKTSSMITNQYSKPKLKAFIYSRPVSQYREDIYLNSRPESKQNLIAHSHWYDEFN